MPLNTTYFVLLSWYKQRLKVGYIYNIVYNCPHTTSEIVDNTISTVNIFKKQYTDNKAS
jgi:hypothetical protein